MQTFPCIDSESEFQDRGPGAGGPCYQWTRTVKGKTVRVALAKEQYEWLPSALSNWRELQKTIKAMQRLSRLVLFETIPHPPRRKKLGKKVLGLLQAPFGTDPESSKETLLF